jgi:threonine synthase
VINDSERRLKCRACSEAFPIGPMFIGCPRCKQGGRIGALEVDYDYVALRSRQIISTVWKNAKGLWAYNDLLPLPKGNDPVSMTEGNTPFVKLDADGKGRIWIKDETRNPTGAHKDRFHSVSISMSRYFGIEKVCAATTGNHGLSLAA